MSTAESFEKQKFSGAEIIGYLDPENPEDKEMIDNLEAAGQECRDQFPTIEQAVDAYRNGLMNYSWLVQGYPEEEVKKLLHIEE